MGRTAKTDKINLVCFSWHVERKKEIGPRGKRNRADRMEQVSGLPGLRALHWRDDSQRMGTSRKHGRGGTDGGRGRNLVRSWLLSALGRWPLMVLS